MEIVFLGMNEAGEKALEWLRENDDVKVLELVEEKDELSVIEEKRPELVVSSGFEHIVPPRFLDVPDKGIVNLHPSLLPFNRGSYPYVWPLLDGTPAGVSIHYMTEEVDEGPVISRRKVEKKDTDTAADLYSRLQDEMFELFTESWPEIKRGVEGTEQDLSKGTVHTKDELEKLRHIDPDQEVEAGELIEKLRALSFPPNGMAFVEQNGERRYLELEVKKEEELGEEQ